MNFRTDLAIEAAADRPTDGQNLRCKQYQKQGATVTHIRVLTSQGEAAVGKPKGRYVTVSLPPLTDDETALDGYARVVGQELRQLLPDAGTVLVVGLGNRTVTPDALGPAVAGQVLATRHIQGEFARTAGLTDLRSVAVLAPGVTGQTGTESGELIRGVCAEIRPVAVVAVDALAARSPERLGRTVQLCDSGIAPGSGVGNNRLPLNRATLGVPVIGVGIPTVVDAATLAHRVFGAPPPPQTGEMMVTPREVDLMIARGARLVAMSLHVALQPAYSPVELLEIARGI